MFDKIRQFLRPKQDAPEAAAAAEPASVPGDGVPRLSINDLRRLVSDAGELAKGTQIADSGGITRFSRFQRRLFAEAAGSGQQPYRVSLDFGSDSGMKPRCSCVAARSRPICKHAAALLVVWSRAPESFAESDTPPAEASATAAATAKKRTVKAGARSADALMSDGIAQVQTLVQELAMAGIATVTQERIAQVRELGAGLREYRLRRLSARTLALADFLQGADTRGDDETYAAILGDMLLTAAKVRKHLSGETMEPRYVEELIGKTWRATDREPVAGLALLEYAFLAHETPDGFTIRESRFLDVETGSHYSEKQIIPRQMAKRMQPKLSFAGKVLEGVAQLYPGFEPRRLYFEAALPAREVTPADVERAASKAMPVARAIERFLEHRRDVFAPPALPAAVAVECIAAIDGHFFAVDTAGDGIRLALTPQQEDGLAESLRGAQLHVLLGSVAVENLGPALSPFAAIVKADSEWKLLSFAAPELELADFDARPARADHDRVDPAIASLAEIREELARALVIGLGGFSARAAEPLATRLREVRAEKIAALIDRVVAEEEPEARVSTFIKADQLLGISMLRMAGSTKVDAAALSPIRGLESIRIREPEKVLSPAEVASLRAEGRLSALEAGWHYGKHYGELGPERLSADVELWADGMARAFLLTAFMDRPDLGLEASRRVLWSESGRTAQATAVAVLQRIGGAAAEDALQQSIRLAGESVRPLVLTALATLQGDRARGQIERHRKQLEAVDGLVRQLAAGGDLDARSTAAGLLGELGATDAIPALRRAFLEDATNTVRRSAAYALAKLCDVGMTELLVNRLWSGNEEAAKTATVALGILGDVRGLPALLRAYTSGFRPQTTGEALLGFGSVALRQIINLVCVNPALGKREPLRAVVKAMPVTKVEAAFTAQLDERLPQDDFPEAAKGILWLSERCPSVQRTIAARILEATEGDKRKGIKVLRRIAEEAMKGG